VLFTGMLTGMQRVEALVDADLFAAPSDHENFGMSIVEALAAGVPVLVSNRVQIYRELERGGVAGIVSRDPGQLAGELTRWLTDQGLRRAAAGKARAFAWQHYSWNQIALRWADEYDRVLARARGPVRLPPLNAGGSVQRAAPERGLRVLHVIPTINVENGGPSVSLLGQVEAQLAVGMRVTVATCWADRIPPEAERYRRMGATVAAIGPTRGKLMVHPGMAAALRDLVGDHEIIHTHAVWEEIIHQAARQAREAGKPYVMSTRGMLTTWSLRQRILPKWLFLKFRLLRDLDRAAGVHFTTEAERTLTMALLGLRAPQMVLPLGVRLSEFEHLPPRGRFRRRFPMLADRPVVIFLGRVHAGKGVEYLVPAMAQVKVPGAVLLVVGPDSGGLRGALERQVAKLGIADRVLFTGMLTGAERVEALVDADLFVLPSDHESFGNSVIEALAAGLPVLVSRRVQTQRELVAAGVAGLVSREPEALAAELTRWLTDQSLRQAAAAKARAFALEHYNWSVVARRWAQEYTRLIAGGGSPDVEGRKGVYATK
jgi:glycosyltransferase involved in cell wall biosynthesis